MNQKIISISLLIILTLGMSGCHNRNGNKDMKKHDIANSPDDLSGKDTYVNNQTLTWENIFTNTVGKYR